MSIRTDKWLWAARFFKTRAQAKEAIDGGKVKVNGARTKPAKEIKLGDLVELEHRGGKDDDEDVEHRPCVDNLAAHEHGAKGRGLER